MNWGIRVLGGPGISFVLMAIMLAGCSPAAPAPPRRGEQSGPDGAQSGRTLVAAIRVEPLTVATRPLQTQGVAVFLSRRMFNADVAILDGSANPRPYLAEALPELNTDDWRVFPDGRMETTYRLKPNLVWHDGAPLSAEDFVFSWQVYATPDLGAAGQPINSIEEAVAPDPRTLVIRWRRPYPNAGSLTDRDAELPALPRHLLQQPFLQDQPDSFANHPYWTTEYVGLGPYRLERWEPGAFIQAEAFERHVLGRPRVERIKVLFITDSNTTLANLLAGELQLSADSSLRVAQAPTLRREWGLDGGTVLLHPNQWRAVYLQLRPEVAAPRAILDPRVRKALAHAVDKDPINAAVYEGDSLVAHTMVAPLSDLGRAVDRAITKYSFDSRRSEQLMADVGFRKAADGIYASPGDGRLVAEVKTNAAADNEAEMSILASKWRDAGFEIQDSVLPAPQARDNQVRASFPALFVSNTTNGVPALLNQTSPRIPKPENRWQGGNRGGWSNSEFDRLVETFTVTLERNERTQLLADATRIHSDELPAISLFFRTQPWVAVSGLRGLSAVAPESNMSWNIHEWELQ